MCWGAGSGSARQSPSVSLSSPNVMGVEGASMFVCERCNDAGGRTAERALDWHCGTLASK